MMMQSLGETPLSIGHSQPSVAIMLVTGHSIERRDAYVEVNARLSIILSLVHLRKLRDIIPTTVLQIPAQTPGSLKKWIVFSHGVRFPLSS